MTQLFSQSRVERILAYSMSPLIVSVPVHGTGSDLLQPGARQPTINKHIERVITGVVLGNQWSKLFHRRKVEFQEEAEAQMCYMHSCGIKHALQYKHL